MTGPQHYLAAQYLLDQADFQGEAVSPLLTAAQVHATLALVAATVAAAVTADHLDARIDFADAWTEAGI